LPESLWNRCLRVLEGELPEQQFNTWVRPLQAVEREGELKLLAPNRYVIEWLGQNLLPRIKELILAFAEGLAPDVALDVGTRAGVIVQVPPAASRDDHAGAAARARKLAPVVLGSRINLDFTFDSFVEGKSNQLAKAAAIQVAGNPGRAYNPLFIYGGVGLGKTHLLHAIGHEIHQQRPDWSISFITCERFVTDFIGSMMHQKRQGGSSSMEDFRARYRNAPDVLLVDDIQFLSNKDSSQDEFFHTFNALHYAHKQIVLTSDKLPAELPGVEDRLRSRFTWGLIAEVETPDLETRVAILKRKAEVDKVDLPDDVALYLAAHVKTNVRELEGALLRLAARASFQGQSISLELARDALAKLIANTPTGLTIESIQREVAAYFDVKLHDLKGPKRHRAIAHPRMVAMFLARKLTNMSYPEIGSRFGGKDHSTVISAVKKIERLCGEDPTVRSVVSTIESHLRAP